MTPRTDVAQCMLCEALCGLEVEHDGVSVSKVRGDAQHPFSRGHICPKGVALQELQNDPDRLRQVLNNLVSNAVAYGDKASPITVTSAIEATRAGDVSAISPFRYSRLIFALAIGIVVFGERPDGWMLGGAALIIASGIYTVLRERARRTLASAPAAG